jgi:hypothetical protein
MKKKRYTKEQNKERYAAWKARAAAMGMTPHKARARPHGIRVTTQERDVLQAFAASRGWKMADVLSKFTYLLTYVTSLEQKLERLKNLDGGSVRIHGGRPAKGGGAR